MDLLDTFIIFNTHILFRYTGKNARINDYLDFIGRIPLVPPNTIVLVAKDNPEQLLDLKNQPNELPGNYFDYYFRNPSKRSLAIPVDLWRVNSIIDRKTSDPYIPVFTEISGNFVENFPHRQTLGTEKKKIERQAALFIQRKIRNLIVKLQGFNSDPVGFGGKFRIKYPR